MIKIKPIQRYTYIFFLVLFIAIEFLLWGFFGTRFWSLEGDYVNNGMLNDIIYTSCNLVVCLVGMLIYIPRTYIYINESGKTMYLKNKKVSINFKDIVYADLERSKTKNDFDIYSINNGQITLTCDKNKKIVEIISKNCHLLTKEQLNVKYPNVKIK